MIRCPRCNRTKTIVAFAETSYLLTEPLGNGVADAVLFGSTTRMLPPPIKAQCNAHGCGWHGTVGDAVSHQSTVDG